MTSSTLLASSIVSAVSIAALAGAAHAQAPADVAPLTAQATPADPTVSITVSPLHLFVPMAELTAEIRLAHKLGVSVIGGIGRFHDKDTDEKIDLLEGGASIRYYVLGTFRTGVQLGAEALYVHASTEAMSIDIKARGLGLSPFVGYKWTHHSGFTFEGQAGATFIAARAKADTGTTAEASKVGVLLNLNVGWSL